MTDSPLPPPPAPDGTGTPVGGLSHAEGRLAAHLDNAPVAVVEWDGEFRVLRWNPQAERLFGWTADEVLGRRPDEIWGAPPGEGEPVSAILGRLAGGRERAAVAVTHTR